ncbi:MAG: aminodeoxychorismate/anthranilate synthase component II [Eubacteriales bacterium]|nr:aminodeoxychorismate/anthranilate synthase component II [Eubacteriales bacterium]
MILLLDNFDSFTYNVYQMVGEFHPDIEVYRNNVLTINEIEALKPSHIILSPGPGYPADAGIMPAVIRHFAGQVPLLGICLGHQGIAEAFGAQIIQAPVPVHGKRSMISLDRNCPMFKNLPPKVEVGRYHSLMADPRSMPDCLAVTATSEDGLIMALQHKTMPVFGLQFHPESILTDYGQQMLKAFVGV